MIAALARKPAVKQAAGRWQEHGLGMDTCGVGQQRWGEGAAESLNPNFTFKPTKTMLHGDPHCEWVVERKK